MLTVKEAAEKLGVTCERVRNMIYDEVLPAEKFGNNWAIPEQAIAARIASKPKRGRPRKNASSQNIQYYAIGLEHQLFKECKETFDGGYDSEIILAAESEIEKSFYVMMWNFFLQQKQKELIDQGVY